MADISKELDNFKNAKYGKDVRGSMVSLAEKLNKESSDTVKTVSEYGDAEVSREQAEQDRQNAENARQQDFETMKSDSQAATIAANKAAERAEQAATGDISLKTVTFEVAAARAGIVSGDTLGVAFGKLAKYCTDIEDHAFNALVNNGLANIAGVSALDAVQANPDVADTLAYKIAQNLAAITSLNSKTTHTVTVRDEQVTIKQQNCCKKNGVVYCHMCVTLPVINYTGAWLLQTPVRPLDETPIHGICANGIVRRFYINTQGILGNKDNIDVSGDYDISFVIPNA